MTTQEGSPLEENQTKTRLLLMLWYLGGLEGGVKKGDLMDRIVRTKEKREDYKPILDKLVEQEAIAISTEKRATHITMTETGKQALTAGLANHDFEFGGNQVGSKVANALLNWIRQADGVTPTTNSKVKTSSAIASITSYDEFKSVALETYDQLNRDYNLDDLVPIYRIRRVIGDRVTRSQFSDWMLEMQEKDILQLQGGGVEDDAPDKLEDSILTKVSGLRCFAKRTD